MATSVKQQTDATVPTRSSADSLVMAEIIMQVDAWTKVDGAEATIEKAVRSLAGVAEAKSSQGQAVSIVLSDDDAVRQLNKAYRGIDKSTNVLSFPSAPGPGQSQLNEVPYLGDVVLAYETVVQEARDLKRATNDHLSHLVIHGVLHLLGYDHETDEDAQQMERLEISLLAELGIANPYEDELQG